MIYKTEFVNNGLRVTVEVEVDQTTNTWILESTYPLTVGIAETTKELHNEIALAIRGDWNE